MFYCGALCIKFVGLCYLPVLSGRIVLYTAYTQSALNPYVTKPEKKKTTADFQKYLRYKKEHSAIILPSQNKMRAEGRAYHAT